MKEGLSPSSEAITLRRSIARRGFPEPFDERERLRALESYAIFGSPPEQTFDDLAKLAAQICHCPIAVVNFIAKDSRWIKASYGLPAGPSEAPRGEQVCAWTVSQPGVFVVADAAHDERFCDLPRVKAGYHFYAGAPLINPEGHALGTLCVVDFDPRELSVEQAEGLRLLARQAVVHLEQRRQIIRLTRATQELAAKVVDADA